MKERIAAERVNVSRKEQRSVIRFRWAKDLMQMPLVSDAPSVWRQVFTRPAIGAYMLGVKSLLSWSRNCVDEE